MYSCTDFTDDVLAEFIRLGLLNDTDLPDDDPATQSELVHNAIQALAKQRDELAEALRQIEEYPLAHNMTNGGDSGHKAMAGIARAARAKVTP